MMKICSVEARQILDSRGVPTVEARVTLENGCVGVGSAPSGASTGKYEAHEKRDGASAWLGRGVARAIEAVNGVIADTICGLDAEEQAEIDRRMIEVDGSENKANLGANALLAVSWAVADAAARARQLPLFKWLGGLQATRMPCPMMNVINGGQHANNNLEMQEFMFVPVGADSFFEAARMGAECYHALKSLLSEAGLSTAVGDEGGFAPNLDSDESALDYMLRAIESAGWRVGEDVALALDAASSQWREGDVYCQRKTARRFDREELIEYYCDLTRRYPIISIEDPLDEEDFEGFARMTEILGENVQIVGDDLFTTNTARLACGAAQGAANAILIKPNQIGTLTETLQTITLARDRGYGVIVSHRSGETISSAIADLAVAVNAEYIKAGAPARGERVAKYNRLMEIERLL